MYYLILKLGCIIYLIIIKMTNLKYFIFVIKSSIIKKGIFSFIFTFIHFYNIFNTFILNDF